MFALCAAAGDDHDDLTYIVSVWGRFEGSLCNSAPEPVHIVIDGPAAARSAPLRRSESNGRKESVNNPCRRFLLI